MTARWRFTWSWIIGAVLVIVLPACGGKIPLPDSDGDGIPDIIDPCPTNPDPTCVPTPPPAEPYDCDNPPALTGPVKTAHPLADRYIVVLKPTSAPEARAFASPQYVAAFAAKFKGVSNVQPLVQAFAAKIDAQALQKLLADPAVQYVEQEGKRKLVALSWGLDRVDQRALPLDKVFNPDGDGAGIDVYVSDTGVTPIKDLEGRVSPDCFSTIVFRGCEDGHGHGTHVAGTAAGTTWGVAKKATVHSVRFLDEQGSGTDSDAIRTLDWIAARPGPGVVNASWGGDPAPAIDAAVCRVIASGKVFVAAAGNESADAYGSTPARVVQVVTVGASDSSDSQAYFSNFGPGLDLYAPGVDIESDTPAGGTAVYSGTSMATPHVVGAAALLLAKYPGEMPAQIRDRLVAAATKDALKGLGAGSPNLLVFVGKDGGPGGLPLKGEPVGPERLLRPDGTRLKTSDGKPFDAVMAVPCCMTFMPREADAPPPRPAPFRVAGVDTPTLWPLASETWQQYTEAKGAANMFHFRLGPFYADADTEYEWEKWGGPYLTPGGEFNPAFWQHARELDWNAYLDKAYVEIVPIDSWGCKHSQGGSKYMPWPKDAIDACGRTWHPEHERYARKVVQEFGCFGNVIWALDNEGQNIQGWQGSWFLRLRDVIRDEEGKSGCGFVHMIGTSVGDVQTKVDYSITHVRAPLTGPIEARWTLNNEHNPSYAPTEEARIFADARAQGLTWALWRDGMNDDDFEDTLARFRAVVEGTVPPPPPPPADACPKPLAPGASVYLNDKAYGHGFDSTPRVKGDPEFCRLIHGEPLNDCHLEGWPNRAACEMQLMGGCPIWQYRMASGSAQRCLQPAHPEASCDHWGSAGGAQDDPHTPIYEGVPPDCGTQRVDGHPAAGFFTVAHGRGEIRACKPDGGGCGPWRPFDH